MPMGICENGHTMNFRTLRSASIKRLLCYECGSPLHPAKYINGQWVRAPKKTRHYCETHRRHYYEPGGCWRCRQEGGKTTGVKDKAAKNAQ